MVSDLSLVIFSITLVAGLIFLIWSIRRPQLPLLHRLMMGLILCYVVWTVPIFGIRFTNPGNKALLFFWDCLIQPPGHFTTVLFLCISIVFVKGNEKMTGLMKSLFILPVVSTLVIWTNPLHHLQYQVFSVIRSEIVFGPWVFVGGVYCYLCTVAGVVLVIRFAIKNKSALYFKQAALLTIGAMAPLVVNIYGTFSGQDFPITATPLSYLVPVLAYGFAIFRYHLLNLKPIATQHILDWISDGYLVISDTGLVISYNKSFSVLFGDQYGITENRYLSECIKKEDSAGKSAVYKMLAAIEESRMTENSISYEQALTVAEDGRKNYFIVDISPLEFNDRVAGFVVLFKDITQIKVSMQQLQQNQERMMEQERLAFLGQMIGGLAHNLKTPIMGISGCVAAVETLVEECEDSLGDPQVEEADWREIYGEMRDWFEKMRESASYMSDIITAIKGQAANAVTFEDTTFTIDEVLRRCALLMRHELQKGNCQMITQYDQTKEIILRGDINNLIQVLDNLLSNAIYAQSQVGGGNITIAITQDEENLQITVKDTGPGVSESVKNRLFKAMVTNKGAMGTGLGLYISNVVIRGKFGGTMWMEDNPGGGSVFGISIPLNLVTIRPAV